MSIRQDHRVMQSVLAEHLAQDFAELSEEVFKPAFEEIGRGMADALYGPLIRELERKIAERDQ